MTRITLVRNSVQRNTINGLKKKFSKYLTKLYKCIMDICTELVTSDSSFSVHDIHVMLDNSTRGDSAFTTPFSSPIIDPANQISSPGFSLRVKL